MEVFKGKRGLVTKKQRQKARKGAIPSAALDCRGKSHLGKLTIDKRGSKRGRGNFQEDRKKRRTRPKMVSERRLAGSTRGRFLG